MKRVNFGAVEVVEGDEDEGGGWVCVFTSNDDSEDGIGSVQLDGQHDTPGEALDAAVRWAKQRRLSVSTPKVGLYRLEDR